MGGTLVPGGATFRVWAPRANAVYVSGVFNGWTQDSASQLNPISGGHWVGFIPGLRDGDEYLFFVDGRGTDGYKRDPRARQLTFVPAFPQANCLLRNPFDFPWHETGFRPPAFHDLVIYQLHHGAFYHSRGNAFGKFLDVVDRLPYLASIGVNAIEPLPIGEFPSEFSLGYNGTDIYSPENDFGEADDTRLRQYFDLANSLLRQRGLAAYGSIDLLRTSDNQLRAMIDLCHIFGIAIIFDVVYNHAGGGFDNNSLYFLDRMPFGNNNDSLYFTDQGFSGGLVFAYWENPVKQFLIDNAKFFYQEYRIDGFRFDEVSTMDRFGGWLTAQHMTDTLRSQKPEAILVAEYWPINDYVVRPVSDGGAGFDGSWHDGIRNTVRQAIAQATGGASASVNLDPLANAIENNGLRNRWRSVQHVENHDIVRQGREPRIARLADSTNSRSWYARSRSRVATGLLLTAPGIPLLFMGQEFLEDKQWNDTFADSLFWAGLEGGDKIMADHLRFTRELVSIRRRHPALRGEGVRVFHVHNGNRVIAFQRWVEGVGRDVIVVATLNESTYFNYSVGFPSAGRWIEVFNSDVYDGWVNPMTAGNGGGVDVFGGTMHGLPASAAITIPANGLLVFARDNGD